MTRSVPRIVVFWVLSVTTNAAFLPLPHLKTPVARYGHMKGRTEIPLFLAGRDGEITTTLSSAEAHAAEVFARIVARDAAAAGTEGVFPGALTTNEALFELLCCLDVEATADEAEVLFRYLDADGDGALIWEDFFPWYSEAAEAAQGVAESFQSLLVGRRTIDQFDETAVSNDILRRAVQCAIAAPNRSMSEPWRFIHIGPTTVAKFARLKKDLQKNMETDDGQSSVLDWSTVPGWCVVTAKVSPSDPPSEQEDFKSVCCAIQNFMLSMWSEGVGTKWTSGPVQKTSEFAALCGVDPAVERVVGCIWYGYATGGAAYADPRRRKKTVDDVLSHLP